MTHSNIEWTLTFGEEKVHDSLARLVDEITPGLIDRLATNPSAYSELITASELVATRAEGLLAETVLSARHAGLTWAQVGKALGIDGQAAQQRFTGTQREDLRERFRRLEAETHNGAQELATKDNGIGHSLDNPRLPPIGTQVTMDNDEFSQVQRGGPYGWHGVAFTTWTWTLEFDNQQWEHATTYLNKPPAGEGWQRIGRWGTTVYWKRPTNLPILPGAPKPESFYSERKLRKELERNRGEQPNYEAVGQVIGATVGGAMAQIIKGPLMPNKVAITASGNNADYTASEQWNRSFLRQSHVEFAFMAGMAIIATFMGRRGETWRYVAAGIVMLGVIAGYLTVGIRSFKGYGHRARRGGRIDRLAPGITPSAHRRRVTIHLGITTIATGLLAWLFPHTQMTYLVFAMMTMVDAWHLLPRRRNIWQVLLVLVGSVLTGLLLTTAAPLGPNEWLAVLIAVGVSTVGASFVVWLEIRNTRETEKYVRLADELRAAQSVIASQQHAAGVFAERERMAGEIHDTLAQGFLAIVTQAQVAKAAIGRNDAAARERLAVIEQVARENLAEARGLVAATAPVPLHDAGLSEALHNLGSRFSNETGIAITVNTPDTDLPELTAPDEVVLIRAAQEALNNIRKHSGSTSATITLGFQEESAFLEITDNGQGMADEAQQGFGLSGMRDRVESVGGTMAIKSAEPGTIIQIELPRAE